MVWNWQQADWPLFTYNKALLDEAEARFLRQSGMLVGSYRHVSEGDKATLTIDLMSNEAFKTSEIEGEILNRESLHSSIRRHFGFDPGRQKILPAERGIADMMVDIYRNYADPLRACSRSFNGKLIQGILTNGGIHEAPIPERR